MKFKPGDAVIVVNPDLKRFADKTGRVVRITTGWNATMIIVKFDNEQGVERYFYIEELDFFKDYYLNEFYESAKQD